MRIPSFPPPSPCHRRKAGFHLLFILQQPCGHSPPPRAVLLLRLYSPKSETGLLSLRVPSSSTMPGASYGARSLLAERLLPDSSATALITSLPRAGLRRPSRQTPVPFLRGLLNSRASAISCPRLASHASPPSPLKAPFKSQGWLTTPLTPAWKALPNICKPYAFLKDPLKGCLLCETLTALGKKHSPVSWPPALSLSLS